MLQACQADIATVGAHLRHILDRFQCLLQDLSGELVDYDLRPHNRRRLEVNLTALASSAPGRAPMSPASHTIHHLAI